MAQQINITNDDAVITITDVASSTTIKSITKDGTSIINGSGENITFRNYKVGEVYSFQYSMVVTPATGSKEGLIGLLESYLKETINTTPGAGSVQDVLVVNTGADPVPVTVENATPIEVDIANTGAILVSGDIKMAQSTIALDAGGETYTTGDVLNAVAASEVNFVFTNVVDTAATAGYITKLRLSIGDVTAAVLNVPFRLYFFNAAPTPIADGGLMTMLAANEASYLGYIDMVGMQTLGAGSNISFTQVTDARLPFICAAASTTLYAIPTVTAGYTRPAAAANLIATITCTKA